MIFFRTLVSFLKNDDYRDLLITTFIILAAGTVVYHFLEGWDWIDSIYFSIITLTTVGYGDFSPQTAEGKIFTIFYIIVGIGIILSFINTVYNHYNDVKIDDKDRKKRRYKRRSSSSKQENQRHDSQSVKTDD
jgi:voltage-gated potassium channel Kch